MHTVRYFGAFIGGILLVAATAIGVGMLALPVATGSAGFLPSFVVYLIVWLFMLCTGLLLLEVCVWMPDEANLITMTRRLLGPWGQGFCWVVYLFLFFTAMIAHVAGGGEALSAILGSHDGGVISSTGMMWIYVLLFSPVVYLGAKTVGKVNSVLMMGVLLAYAFFIYISFSHVDTSLLKHVQWSKAWSAIPILFAAFTYQLIIPTLMTYLKRDVKKVRAVVIIGSSIPLLVYLVWEFLILGIVPVDRLLLGEARGEIATIALKEILHHPRIYQVGNWFAFLVLTTSYLALALAFLDFLADGFKIKHHKAKKLGLCLIVFLIPTLIAVSYPGMFLTALKYAGGVSCTLLFGLLPPIMVWVGRYVKKYHPINAQGSVHRFPGGKPVLIVVISFVLVQMTLQLIQLLGS